MTEKRIKEVLFMFMLKGRIEWLEGKNSSLGGRDLIHVSGTIIREGKNRGWVAGLGRKRRKK